MGVPGVPAAHYVAGTQSWCSTSPGTATVGYGGRGRGYYRFEIGMAQVIIAPTFLQSAAALSQSNSGRLWMFLQRLMDDTLGSGANLEPVRQAQDPDVMSARVSQGVRAILRRIG